MEKASAFTHKPKKLQKFAVRPGKPEWDRVWASAKSQPWWTNSDEISYVGCDETFWYFQKRGVTSGLARLVREVAQ